MQIQSNINPNYYGNYTAIKMNNTVSFQGAGGLTRGYRQASLPKTLKLLGVLALSTMTIPTYASIKQPENKVVESAETKPNIKSNPLSYSYALETAGPNKPTRKKTFNINDLNNKLNHAGTAAEVVDLQTEALNYGIDFRDRAIQVNLTDFHKYNDTEYWEGIVSDYNFSQDITKLRYQGNLVQVHGAKYDSDERPINERVMGETGENILTLTEELTQKSFPEHVLDATRLTEEEAKVMSDANAAGLSLSSVANIDVTALENLTTENSNEQISELGDNLLSAAHEVDNAINVLNMKIETYLGNIKIQNDRIDGQIDLIKKAESIIREFVGQENSKDLEAYYNSSSLSKKNYDTYEQYDARDRLKVEAHDRRLMRIYLERNGRIPVAKDSQGNLVIDFSDNSKRDEYEGAFRRLSAEATATGVDVQSQLSSIKGAQEAIEEYRQNAVVSLREVERYQILNSQLSQIQTGLYKKGDTLFNISQNLATIDKFFASAQEIADRKHESESAKAGKTADAASTSISTVNQSASDARETIAEDNNQYANDKQDTKTNKKAKKHVKKADRNTTISNKRTVSAKDARELVKRYESSLAYMNDANYIYNPHPELTVPPELRDIYRSCLLKFRNDNVSFVLNDNNNSIIMYNNSDNRSIRIYPDTDIDDVEL